MNEMKLLAGHPIYVDNIPILSPKLTNISLLGEETYTAYLHLCMTEGLNLLTSYENKYDHLIHMPSEDFFRYFYLALEFFTGQTFKKHSYNNDTIFVSESSVLYRDNYDRFVEGIKIANCIEAYDSNTITTKRNPDLDQKIAQAKQAICQKLNKPTEDPTNITLTDLISVLASKHYNLNIVNIWDLTIYQFNNQFKRMQLIENYDIGIRSLLAGADKNDVPLEHYIKKIK